MKNTILLILIIAITHLSCRKELPKPTKATPVVTLNGNSVISVDFGSDFSDPGATAMDYVHVSVPVVVTGAVNINAAGIYTLTYAATDVVGNVGTATRTVYVIHRKTNIAGTYTVNENCIGPSGSYIVGPYAASITPGSATNMALVFNNFGDYATSITMSGILEGNTGQEIQIPTATPGLTISGTGTINASGSTLNITYTGTDGTFTDNCAATWIKQ